MKKFRYLLLAILIVSITIISSVLIDKKNVNAEEAAAGETAAAEGETTVQQCQTFNIVATGEHVDYNKYWYGEGDPYNRTGFTANATQDYEGMYGEDARNLSYAIYKATCTDEASGLYGKEYLAYCIDAGISGPDSGGTNSYVLEENLDLNADDSWGKASRGLLYIYKQSGYDIIQQSMAMRLIMTKWGITDPSAKYKIPFEQTVIAIESGKWNKETWDTLGKKENGQLNTTAFYPKTYIFDYSEQKVDRANDFALAVSSLYMGAKNQEDATLEQVSEVKLEIGEVTLNNPTFNNDGTFTSEARVQISGLDTVTGTGSYVKFKELVCSSGVTCDTTISSSDSIIDLSSDGKTYEFVINISGNASSLTADSFKISLSFDYYTPSDSNNVLLVVDTDASVEYQRFVLFDEDSTGQILKKDGEDVSMCESLATSPTLSSSPEWKEYYDKYCNPTCFSSPNLDPSSASFDEELFASMCCDILDSLKGAGTITESQYSAGKEKCVDQGDCVTYDLPAYCDLSSTSSNGWVFTSMYEGIPAGETEVDYGACVLNDFKDAVGNELRIVSNAYCDVACIESWDFKLPNKNFSKANDTAIKAGQYFALAAQLEGTRTCVTSLEIDYDQFQDDVDNANKTAVDKFNEYLKETAKAEAAKDESKITVVTQKVDIEKKTTKTQTTSPNHDAETDTYSCPFGYTSKGSGASMTCEKEYVETTKVGEKTCVKEYKVNWSAVQQGYSIAGDYENSDVVGAANASGIETVSMTINTTPAVVDGPNTQVTCEEDTSKSKAVSNLTSEQSQFVSNANTAYSEYEEQVEAIEVYINDIKDCSDWTEEIDESFYKPEITFEYDEGYYMGMIGDDNVFVSGNIETSEDTKFCSGTAESKTFACQGEEKPESQKTTINYIKCVKDDEKCYKKSGSFNSKKGIPTNISVKKEVSAKSLMKPKPEFYTLHTSGEVVMSDQPNATKLDIGGVYNGHVLPIRLTTAQGLYQYRLTLKNIGMFSPLDLDDSGMGRLIGTTSSVYSKLKVKEGDTDYNFVCTYEVVEDVCICCGDESITERVDVSTGTPKPAPGGGLIKDTGATSSASGKIAFTYRPISLNTIGDPTNLSWTAGTNWGTAKGLATLQAINEEKENIYTTPEYSFLITPEGVATLQQMGVSDTGEELTCQKQDVNVYGGGTSEEVVCLSDLVTGIYNDDYGDSIQPLVSRPGFTYRYETATVININDVVASLSPTLDKQTVTYAGAWK